MKKSFNWQNILAAVLSLTLLLTACSGTPDTAKDSTSETTPAQETTAQSPAEKNTTELPATEQPATEPVAVMEEQRFNVQELKYGSLLRDVAPAGQIRASATLPDLLQKAIGKTEDKKKDNKYYIAALDLTLEIPEGYHLYRVDGLYRDSEGNPIRLEFVDEYILALRDISEEELISEIYAYEEEGFDRVRPHWVLWNFKVFHKDYLPAEELFESRIQVTGELRKAGDYWLETGTLCGWLNTGEGWYIARFSPELTELNRKYYGKTAPADQEAMEKEMDSKYDWPLRIAEDQWYTDTFMQAILENSTGCGVEYNYQQDQYTDGSYFASDLLFLDDPANLFIGYRNPAASIASEDWWKDYTFALDELEKDPETYVCPEIPISFETYSQASEPWLSRQKEQFAGWQQNMENEKNVRACVYAWLKTIGRETSLENIVIYMKDSPMGASLFLAFTMDPADNSRLTPVMKGIDVLSFSNMEQAKEYAEKYVQLIP